MGLCVALFSLEPVIHHVVVVDVHQDGERLTNDDGHPHRSVAVVTPQKAANKPG